MSNYEVRAFCKCGWSDRAPFGDPWFVRQRHPVCPKCGEDGHGYEKKTARLVSVGWFKTKWEIKEPRP